MAFRLRGKKQQHMLHKNGDFSRLRNPPDLVLYRNRIQPIMLPVESKQRAIHF